MTIFITLFINFKVKAVDWEDLTEFPDGAYKNYEETHQRAKEELAQMAAPPTPVVEVKEAAPVAPTATSPVLDLINEDSVPLSQSGMQKEEIKPLWSFPEDKHPRRKKSR